MDFKWDGFDEMYFGFNKLDRDDGQHGRKYAWVCWIGPLSIRKRRS